MSVEVIHKRQLEYIVTVMLNSRQILWKTNLYCKYTKKDGLLLDASPCVQLHAGKMGADAPLIMKALDFFYLLLFMS